MSEFSYEPFAQQYDQGSKDNPFNVLLERPAVEGLLGSVGGKDVLEVGSAGGRLTSWLVDQGARVVALDASPTLIALARDRVPTGATFHVHDVAQPLRFLGDRSVDSVVASLTMHYVRDWKAPLKEFRRVLRPDGRLVLSTHHPCADFAADDAHQYYEVERLVDTWSAFGEPPLVVRYYRRPLGLIFQDLRDTRFRVSELREPRPRGQDRTAFGAKWEKVANRPWFMVIAAEPARED